MGIREASSRRLNSNSERVGLLAFHQAVVNNPQDSFVIWVFASVLYNGKWEEGVKFAREHAKDQVNFAPEISGFSEIESDEELAAKDTELTSLVQDCVSCLTLDETHSYMHICVHLNLVSDDASYHF